VCLRRCKPYTIKKIRKNAYYFSEEERMKKVYLCQSTKMDSVLNSYMIGRGNKQHFRSFQQLK